MEHWYHVEVTIADVARARCRAVTSAVEAVWPVEEWRVNGTGAVDGTLVLTAGGNGALIENMTIDLLAQRLTNTIWTAHGAFCPVTVVSRCLDPQPVERRHFDADRYARRLAAVSSQAAD